MGLTPPAMHDKRAGAPHGRPAGPEAMAVTRRAGADTGGVLSTATAAAFACVQARDVATRTHGILHQPWVGARKSRSWGPRRIHEKMYCSVNEWKRDEEIGMLQVLKVV